MIKSFCSIVFFMLLMTVFFYMLAYGADNSWCKSHGQQGVEKLGYCYKTSKDGVIIVQSIEMLNESH